MINNQIVATKIAVAAGPHARSIGLLNRDSLAPHEGLQILFPTPVLCGVYATGIVAMLSILLLTQSSNPFGLQETLFAIIAVGMLSIFTWYITRLIHTIGMRFPIDLLFHDCNDRILSIRPRVMPGDLVWLPVPMAFRTVGVIELAAGVAERFSVQVGDTLQWSARP